MSVFKRIIYVVFATLFIVFFTVCSTVKTLTKEELMAHIDQQLLEQNYRFEATRANPASGQSIPLSSSYSLEVRPDSVIAYLPYFGRAYTAPSPTSEGGIKFVSTDFEYTRSEKEKGVYRIAIEVNDSPDKYRLSLLIGETGQGTLYVTQTNKQAITFYGNVD